MTTATLSPTEDTYVESGSTANNSAGTSIFADITATSIRRSYLKFDIASLNIPSNAVVYSAYLKLPIQTEYVSPVTISVQRATAAWTASTITYATQPALETSDASTTSDVNSGYRRVLVTAQVQKMANMPALDKGFCVHRYNETGSARLYQYNSNENTGTKPVLEINYYVPFYANNSTTIQHASSAVATDAVISPQIAGGQGGTISYQWYNSSGSAISGATNLTLSGLGYGWYGLRISSTIGDPVYVAFLVGVNCEEVNIDFEPGPLYINDAMLYERNDGTINYGNLNYGTNARVRADNNALPDWYSQRSLIQFNLWVDPALNIIQSDLNLTYESHNISRPNTSEVLMVTEPWFENTVTHNMGIATTSTDRIELPVVAGGAENGIIDLKNYWDFWKQDNTQNFGLLMQLTLYDNATACRRSYHSSDAADTTKLPYITFKVSLPVYESDILAYNYFDALGTGWGYTIGTPSYTGTGTTGTDVTGVKVIDGNKVMAKSYSTGNSTGQRASTNTVTFSNITGLGGYDQLDLDFELASLGTATTDAGVDTGEDFDLEVSTDNGSTWVSILTAAGGSNLLFPLAATPVTALNIQSTHAWTSGESHYRLSLDGVTQLRFRFTAKNNRTNENWALDNIRLVGVHKPLSSAWENTTGLGSITFNYKNPCTSVGPYTYFISELPIPSMKDSYHFLKDSIFGGVLDSTSFFAGSEALLTHTFTDLPMSNYYVSVFDSRGELVYAGQQAVHPDLPTSSVTNITQAGNKFTASATDSKVTIDIYADETTRGGMELEISGITGNQSYGFVSNGVTFAGYSTFETGFHVINEKVYTVKKGVLSSGYTTATAGSKLGIIYEEGLVNYIVDGTTVDTETPSASFDVVLSAKRDKGSFHFAPIRLNLYPFYLFTTTTANGDCDDNEGSFTFDVFPYFSSSVSYNYVVKDVSNTTVASGTHTTSNPHTTTVSQTGIYTLILTSSSLPGVTIIKTIYVGVESDWTQVDKYGLDPNSYSLKRDATSAGNFSKARSRNALPEAAVDEWVRFTATAPNITLNNQTKNYITFSNISASGVPGSSETFLEFHYQIAMLSIYPGISGTPAGVRMTYKEAGGSPHSIIIPVNAQVTVLFTLGEIIVKANDVIVATLTRPSGIIQLKANSNKVNQGFQNVVTSFGCTIGDEIYAGLKYKLDGYYHIMLDGKIRFEYEEEYSATNLKFNLYDNMDQLVKTQADFPSFTTSHGSNLVTLDVSDDAHCIGQKYFYLEVINEKKERFYLRFFNNYTGCN